MLEYVKQNGTKVMISDRPQNVEAAKSLGWKPYKEQPKPEQKKATKKKKAN